MSEFRAEHNKFYDGIYLIKKAYFDELAERDLRIRQLEAKLKQAEEALARLSTTPERIAEALKKA